MYVCMYVCMYVRMYVEEEGFYKFLPANTADRLWQSLSKLV